MLIGLTGMSGAGKSTVASILKRKGFRIIDCDALVHSLYEDIRYLRLIKDAFGEEYFFKNNYNTNKWNKMQLAGAVFLPACGYRNGTEIGNINITGVYWTTTCNEQNNPQYLYFCSNYLSLTHANIPYYGQAVRLVCK